MNPEELGVELSRLERARGRKTSEHSSISPLLQLDSPFMGQEWQFQDQWHGSMQLPDTCGYLDSNPPISLLTATKLWHLHVSLTTQSVFLYKICQNIIWTLWKKNQIHKKPPILLMWSNSDKKNPNHPNASAKELIYQTLRIKWHYDAFMLVY